jgi:hypothetical protein
MSLVEGRLVIARVDAREHLPSLDRLVVVDRHLGDILGLIRTDRRIQLIPCSFAEHMRSVLAELAALSARRAATVLNERKVPTAAGGRWSAREASAPAAGTRCMITNAGVALSALPPLP